MAVVKIVPMPGIKITGPTGPQGPQGIQGIAGKDGLVPTSGTWDTQIQQYSGIVGGTLSSPDAHLGRYYTVGDLVFLEVQFGIKQPTSWGTNLFGGLLPFKMANSWQENILNAERRQYMKGSVTLRGDVEPFGFPYSDDENASLDITVVLIRNPDDNSPDFFLFATNDTNESSVNINTDSSRAIEKTWPVNLNVPNFGNSPYFSVRFSGVYRKA